MKLNQKQNSHPGYTWMSPKLDDILRYTKHNLIGHRNTEKKKSRPKTEMTQRQQRGGGVVAKRKQRIFWLANQPRRLQVTYLNKDNKKNDTPLTAKNENWTENKKVQHWHRPGFNGQDFSTDRHIFLHVNRTINCAVPHRWVVCPIDDVDLHLDRTWQRWVALVLGHRLQFVRFALLSSCVGVSVVGGGVVRVFNQAKNIRRRVARW